jgi:hypothetical protein
MNHFLHLIICKSMTHENPPVEVQTDQNSKVEGPDFSEAWSGTSHFSPLRVSLVQAAVCSQALMYKLSTSMAPCSSVMEIEIGAVVSSTSLQRAHCIEGQVGQCIGISSHRVQCCKLSLDFLVPSAHRSRSADTFHITLIEESLEQGYWEEHCN